MRGKPTDFFSSLLDPAGNAKPSQILGGVQRLRPFQPDGVCCDRELEGVVLMRVSVCNGIANAWTARMTEDRLAHTHVQLPELGLSKIV